MPAQANATLVRVTTATAATGGRDDWDAPGAEPAGAGVDKWAGSVPAYYRQKVQRLQGANGPDVQTVHTVWVDTVDARRIGVDTDDVLHLVTAGGTVHGTAQAVAYSELDGVDPDLATTRIDFEPA